MTSKMRQFATSLLLCFILANINFPTAEAWESKGDSKKSLTSAHTVETQSEAERSSDETEKASLRISDNASSKDGKQLSDKQLRIMGMLTLLLSGQVGG